MKNGISLCLPYYRKIQSGELKLTMFRVADLEDGEYIPVNPMLFTDYSDEFYPRYLRYPTGAAPHKYSPVFRRWSAIPKKDDFNKSSTESFIETGTVFEVVINPEYMNSDDEIVLTHLKNGIHIPDGIDGNFLLAIEQKDYYYRVALCKKNHFRQRGDKYYLTGNIDDLVHATHHFKTYIINCDDVFNIDDVSRFWLDENAKPVETRSFYLYDRLPEQDGNLYLYQFSDYLPIYLSKYIKANSTKLGMSKNSIQAVINIVKEALANKRELESFFEVSGYEYSDFEAYLPKYEQDIIEYLDEQSFLDDIVTKILGSSEEMKAKYIAIATKMWFEEKDELRQKYESELNALENEKHLKLNEIDNANRKLHTIDEACKKMTLERDLINASIVDVFDSLDKRVDECLINNHILNRVVKDSHTQTTKTTYNDSNILVRQTSEKTDEPKVADDIKKACQFLEYNLKQAGMESQYGRVLSNAFLRYDTSTSLHSVILSGVEARNIANAFAYSLDGKAAPIVILSNSTVSYTELYNIVNEIPERVILLENLLDSCNDIVYMTLNKDFPNKLFLFSYESDKSLALLPTSIWNYSLLLNTEFTSQRIVKHPKFISVNHAYDYELEVVSNDTANYTDLLEILSKFGMSVHARNKYVSLISKLESDCGSTAIESFIDVYIAKLCIIYDGFVEMDFLDERKSSLSTAIRTFYSF